jgi:hypothetical protein
MSSKQMEETPGRKLDPDLLNFFDTFGTPYFPQDPKRLHASVRA